MIIPSEKINVFISSTCGDTEEKHKYNLVRAGLKALIESMHIAKVYVFEDEGASTNTAGQNYTYALKDSDVCIFLIDNKDGVSQGVQFEIDTVKKHNIKSLYYFCDKYSKEETPLQKSLKGASFAKSKVVHSFEDFITHGAKDLVEDIVDVYKQYCKGRLNSSFNLENIEDTETTLHLINSPDTQEEYLVSKNVLHSIGKCKNYFSKMFSNNTTEIRKTHSFDRICFDFLPILFEGKSISQFNITKLLSEIKKQQSNKHFQTVKKRWFAIEKYYQGNLEECIKLLKEALILAKTNKAPDWLIKDILIDLRNQSELLDECNNSPFDPENQYQKELTDSKYLVHYPILDRFHNNFFEQLAKDSMKDKLESPYTVTLGHNLQVYIDYLTSSFILSMFTGSLTHLNMLYKKIMQLSFYYSEKYLVWEFKTLLLKTTIFGYNTKKIKSMTEHFDEILCQMNSDDAGDIFDFSKNKPLIYQRFMVQLEALSITAYFMSDAKFKTIWDEIYREIIKWIEDERSFTECGHHIYNAILNIHSRISMENIVTICYKSIKHRKRRFFNDVFEVLYRCVDINDVSNSDASELIKSIVEIISIEKERINIRFLDETIISFRKQNQNITKNLNTAISNCMPEFYEHDYRLETSNDEDADLPAFIEKCITDMKERNKTQGTDGSYILYADQPFLTIKSILVQTSIFFEKKLINLIFKTASETLLEEQQTVSVKIDAISLLIYLSKTFPYTLSENANIITKTEQSRNVVESYNVMLSIPNREHLQFSLLIFKICLNVNVSTEIMEMLSIFGDDTASQIHASKTILSFLKAGEYTQLNLRLETIILQNTLNWCNSSNTTIRWYAVSILFLLLRNSDNLDIICNQLVKHMRNDNVYIKTHILRKIEVIRNVDSATYDYVLQIASLDTNYVVRKVYVEIKSTNPDSPLSPINLKA